MASQNISGLSQAKRAPQAANFAALLEAVALDPAAVGSTASVPGKPVPRKPKSVDSGSPQPALAQRSQTQRSQTQRAQSGPHRAQVVASPRPRPQARVEPDTSSRKPPKSLRVSRKDAAPPAVRRAAQEPALKFVERKPRPAQKPLPAALHPDALHEDLLASDTVAIHSAAPPVTASLPASATAPNLSQEFGPQEFKSQEFKPQDFSPLEGQRWEERSAAGSSTLHDALPDRKADDGWVRWPGPRRKCVTISVRLSPDDAKMLRRRAGESQLSVSDYMRSCVIEADQLRAQVKQALAEMKRQGMDLQSAAAREETAPAFAPPSHQPHQPHPPYEPPQPRESRLKGWFSGLRTPLTPASAISSQR